MSRWPVLIDEAKFITAAVDKKCDDANVVAIRGISIIQSQPDDNRAIGILTVSELVPLLSLPVPSVAYSNAKAAIVNT